MNRKIALLSMIGGILLNGSLCFCSTKNSPKAPGKVSCGRCHQNDEKESTRDGASKSQEHQSPVSPLTGHGCKDCGCSHGTLAVCVESDTLVLGGVTPLAYWGIPWDDLANPTGVGFQALLLTGRSPPPASCIPLFILHLHLAI